MTWQNYSVGNKDLQLWLLDSCSAALEPTSLPLIAHNCVVFTAKTLCATVQRRQLSWS